MSTAQPAAATAQAHGEISWRHLFVIALELVLVLLLLRQYQIENGAFLRLAAAAMRSLYGTDVRFPDKVTDDGSARPPV